MLEVEQVLQNRYQLKQKLGDNAVRQTWLAEDLASLDAKPTQVVVKLLAFGGQVQWENLKLFEREAQILKQLNHSRIPKYRDYFCIDERWLWFGLVQEYIPGSSLKAQLAQGKRFSEQQVCQIAESVLQILMYLHQLNSAVLHRDIKPSNLIWGEDEQVYLVDFGAVQDRAAIEGATFTVVGTYGYAPMEQFGGRTVPASDLYALGATLIHLLTGIAPADLPQSHLRIQFTERVSLRPSFVSWLEKMTEPAPEQRFESAMEALDALTGQSLATQQLQHSLVVNNSEDGFRNSITEVPEEIKGWNWGAFLLPWFWPLTNGQAGSGLVLWITLVSGMLGGFPLMLFMDLLVAIMLGTKGNKMAWSSRRWRSIQHFKAHQRGWAIAGVIFWIFWVLWITRRI